MFARAALTRLGAAAVLLAAAAAGPLTSQGRRDEPAGALAPPSPGAPEGLAAATPSRSQWSRLIEPQSLGAHAEAGTLVFADGGSTWRYQGASGNLEPLPEPGSCPPGGRRVFRSPDGTHAAALGADHKLALTDELGRTRTLVSDFDVEMFEWSPTGRRLAVGRLPAPGTTRPLPGASLGPWMFLPNELWLVDVETGRARLLYDEVNTSTPQYYPKVPFRIATWSPDDRYIAVQPGAGTSASLEADGLELILIDTLAGRRTSLGAVLTKSDLVWTAPDTLTYVAGGGRETWRHKTVRMWSPESGVRDVSPPGEVGLAPSWDPQHRLLFFVRGPEGEYRPEEFFAGRGVGDRHLAVYDASTGTIRELQRSLAFAEEGARVSDDGTALLVLRRRLVDFRADGSTQGILELWLLGVDGSGGRPLVRLASSGFGFYGSFGILHSSEWSRATGRGGRR